MISNFLNTFSKKEKNLYKLQTNIAKLKQLHT